MLESKSFFRVEHRNLWGDYGHMLIAGMGLRKGIDSDAQLFDRNAPLELERTGPFVPSITIVEPNIVVTDECKQQMSTDYSGLTFKPVVKKLIVMSEWEHWDWAADEPQEYPDEGEPENYVMYHHPHSVEAADKMGPMWELCIEKGAWLDTDVQRARWDYDLRIHADSWNGLHLFWAEQDDTSIGQWIIATDVGKQFLDAYDKHKLLEFLPCLTK